MNKEADRFDELLARLPDGECGEAERSELARLCAGNAGRCRQVMECLVFEEMLRQASVAGEREGAFVDRIVGKLGAGCDDTGARVLGGEVPATDKLESWLGEIAGQADLIDGLRDELSFDDLIGQAASEARSEEAFVQALSTRMWAEVEEDHFVEDLNLKIVELDVAQQGRSVTIPLPVGDAPVASTWWAARWKPVLAAAAAVMLSGVMLWHLGSDGETGRVVAESGAVAWDAEYGKIPAADGSLGRGAYRLESGVVHLRFAGGAEMSVEGPAEFAIENSGEVDLRSGIALARDAAGGKGEFTLAAKGIDLAGAGSTVGVDARDGDATEMVVFNGGAEVQLSEGGDKRQLHDFEAVRADLERGKLVDIPLNTRPYAKAWELMSGVAVNNGSVDLVVPGARSRLVAGDKRVRVSVERDQFKLADGEQLEVDTLSKGRFVAMDAMHGGEVLAEKGQLRSYLLELKPGAHSDGDGGVASSLEASMTFDHPIVGMIFSEDRLRDSDELLGGASGRDLGGSAGTGGLVNDTAAEGQVLLSDDGRTVNLVLPNKGSKPSSGTVRVLVALN